MIFLVYGDFNWGDPDAASCNPQSPTHPPTALLRAIGREAHRTICYGIGCGDGPHVLIQRREGPKNFCGAVASIIAPFRQKNGCKISWKRDRVKGEATQFLESTLVLRGEHMITCCEEERKGVESTDGVGDQQLLPKKSRISSSSVCLMAEGTTTTGAAMGQDSVCKKAFLYSSEAVASTNKQT